MIIFFFFVLLLSVLALSSSVYVLFLAVVGLSSAPDTKGRGTAAKIKFLILIPAHNEERGITGTLEAIKNLGYPSELLRVVVIADNCVDKTAAIVRSAGFECWERHDPYATGKGQALRWALDLAKDTNFEAVAVVDADSRVHPDLLNSFAAALDEGASAVQVRYDFESAESNFISGPTVLGKNAESTLFWRPRHRLGLAVFLQGNGFCLTHDLLRQLPWSAYSIVEDVEYSLNLARHGIRVAFVETANVVAHSVESTQDGTPQRIRWASGTVNELFHTAPEIALAGLRQANFFLVEAALALVLLSRMVLVYMTAGALIFSFVLPQSYAGLIRSIVAVTVAIQFLYLLCAVRANTKDSPAWKSLILIPRYLCWLLVVQVLALLRHRRQVWTRTPR